MNLFLILCSVSSILEGGGKMMKKKKKEEEDDTLVLLNQLFVNIKQNSIFLFSFV